MKITQVKVFKQDKDKLRGFASVTLDNCFVITGLKIMVGSNGMFVAMPSQKKGEEYKDVCFPITKEFRQELIDAVLNEYCGEGFTAMDEDLDETPF